MRNVRLVALICGALASLPACVVSSGRLESNRYQHAIYPYALFYPESGRAESPLGPHYTLENFRSPDGRHRYEKAGDGFTIVRDYADNNPPVKQGELFYDLLLSRDSPKAQVWVRTVPLRRAEAELPLTELAGRYLDNAAQVGRVAAPIGIEVVEGAGEKAGVRNVTQSACTLSKREALRIDFELENKVPSAEAQPAWLAGTVVLVRSGYATQGNYPVLLLAGRSSAPDDKAALESDFDRMLERLVLGDKGQGLSMKGGHTCRADGSAPAAGEASSTTSNTTSSGSENTVQQLEVPLIQEDATPEPLPADSVTP